MSRIFISLIFLLVLCNCTKSTEYDIVITGGGVIDGTGSSAYRADIAIHNDRIVLITEEQIDPNRAKTLINAEGLIVAPGFIDMHSHFEPIFEYPDAENHIRQGITTGRAGPDGRSPLPLGETMEALEVMGFGINIAYTVGHNTIREYVMGMDSRPPTGQELERMKSLVDQSMKEGAWGLSTGLKYTPGTFAETDELVELSKVAAGYGGIYSSHLREEGLDLVESVQELIEIGDRASIPANLTHHKVVGHPMWGKSELTLAMIDSARGAGIEIVLDQYPYTATFTTIAILIPEWAKAGGTEKLQERLADPALRDSIKKGIEFNIINDRGGNDLSRVQLARVPWNEALEGKTLEYWAEQQGMEQVPESGAELVIKAIIEGGADAIFHALHEEDVVAIMQHAQTMIGSDGSLTVPSVGHPHPRWYGTFPRILGKYVREDGVLELEQAIRKMTGMPADFLGIERRGYLREEYFADLVVFDPDRVIDKSTFLDPHQYPEGITYVIINGGIAVDNGQFNDIKTGRILRRGIDGGR